MIGLRYIREMHNISTTDLAKKLGVSHQAVSAWEQGKTRIPKKRLAELSIFFGMPKEYFSEISDIQELEIDKYMLDRGIVKSEYEYDVDYIDDDGNLQSITMKGLDSALILHSEYYDAQISKKKLLKKIDSIISGDKRRNSMITLEEEIEQLNNNVDLFDRFSDIANVYRSHKIVFKVLRALEIAVDIKKDESGIAGLYGLIDDDDKFIQQLKKIIAKEYEKQNERRIAEQEMAAIWMEENNIDYGD